jgi:hypothetical protein
MMTAVIDNITVFLSSQPDPLLAAARIGDRLPSSSGDVPAVAVSLAIDGTRGSGVGSFLREGNQLVKNTSIVDIAVSAATFTSDLKTLRLSPLPVRKNPASRTVDFSQDDVNVTRITGPGQPVAYRYADRPEAVDEFRVDAAAGRIVFGAAQPGGERLEVAHWTVSFRDDITGGRCHGLLTLEVWGGSANEASAVARKLEGKMADRPGLRQRGFAALSPAGLTAIENISYQPATGSAFPVWKQKLTYKFHFDSEQGGEAGSGGPILQVNVDMNQTLDEQFTTPAGS